MTDNDSDMEALSEQLRIELLPKMADSAVVVSLLPSDPEKFDAKLIIEIGACLLLDKPLILSVPRGTVIPERLHRAADRVIRYDPDDPDAMKKLAKEVSKMVMK